MLLIGSRAIKYWYPEFRTPKDWDIIAYEDEVSSWIKENKGKILYYKKRTKNGKIRKLLVKMRDKSQIEFNIVSTESDREIYLFHEINNPACIDFFGTSVKVCCPMGLFALKKSHTTFPIHWYKNIEDYHFLRTKLGTLTNPIWLRISQQRSWEIEDRIGLKKPNLNMTNDAFFAKTRGVRRFFVHDDLHKLTCFYSVPLYEKCKRDLTKAKLDYDLFEKLDDEDKIRLVQEEAIVIALERKIIPRGKDYKPLWNNDVLDWKSQKYEIVVEKLGHKYIEDMYLWAVMRICTTLTSGWFREFAIEHYPEVRNLCHCYVQHFLVNLEKTNA